VHELLRALSAGSRVLDLGCGLGTFRTDDVGYVVFRVDIEWQSPPPANFVQADAASLPFRDQSFDGMISNNSMEHFGDLQAVLKEIKRVLKPGASLYVAAPDAGSLSDRLYRRLASGGGHVNAFYSAAQLAEVIGHATGLRHVATRSLCTSFSFLNRHNSRGRIPRKLCLMGGGTEISLHIYSYFLRALDRYFHTHTTVYGWALFFGAITGPIDRRTWTNVCVRCGAGHPSSWLERLNIVQHRSCFRTYRCPNCGTNNIFSDDENFPHLVAARNHKLASHRAPNRLTR